MKANAINYMVLIGTLKKDKLNKPNTTLIKQSVDHFKKAGIRSHGWYLLRIFKEFDNGVINE